MGARYNVTSYINILANNVKISDELCDFMSVEHGTKMNCAEAGKRVHMYIKEHKLQDPSNGININLKPIKEGVKK